MRQVIDEHATTGYTPPVAASEIVAKLRQNEPELLAAWLEAQAEHMVCRAINQRDHSQRAHAVQRAKSSAFREASKKHEQGDTSAMQGFLDTPYTVKDGSRRRLRELQRADVLYVAHDYELTAKASAFRSAFFRAIAKQLEGRATVADRYTEQQLQAMWSSLSG